MSYIRRRLILTAIAVAVAGAAAEAQVPKQVAMASEEAARSLAPTGTLRVAINVSNVVLAQRSAKGELAGVTVVLARALAERLKLPIELVPFETAVDVFNALDKGTMDLGFLAIEPERAAKIDFSPPYVSIDGTYLVRTNSPFQTVSDLDKPGVRIAVGRGAAYDLFLTRALKQAQLVRAPTAAASVDMFVSDRLEAAAGVRQFLVERAAANPGLRVLKDRFTSIEQAMTIPKGREAGLAYVGAFIEEMKASGAVRKALDATGQSGATVAPAVLLSPK